MPSSPASSGRRIKAIIFDMDNTLFDFVAAKHHACREVAKFLGRDDWEALFNCFINSPHGFESHENIKDYLENHAGLSLTAKADFNLCGLLEACSARKDPGETEEKREAVVPSPSPQNILADNPPPERENVVRIQISRVSGSPAKSSPPGLRPVGSPSGYRPSGSPPGSPPTEARAGEGQITVPSACAIPPKKGATSPLRQVRDNLLADKSLYCNEVFSRCCAIYEAEKVRVLEPYPGVRETLAELKRRHFPLAVLTDAHNGNAMARLRRTGLSLFFDYVISYDMTGAKKPAPDAFVLALKKLGTSAPETLLVGDSIRRDIAPAQALGMITAYAKYGDRNIRGRDPPDCRPDFILDSIEELLDLTE
jgi:HAD superfamily hydrolase (TIGR01509 family)